jgi:hypothetical protein
MRPTRIRLVSALVLGIGGLAFSAWALWPPARTQATASADGRQYHYIVTYSPANPRASQHVKFHLQIMPRPNTPATDWTMRGYQLNVSYPVSSPFGSGTNGQEESINAAGESNFELTFNDPIGQLTLEMSGPQNDRAQIPFVVSPGPRTSLSIAVAVGAAISLLAGLGMLWPARRPPRLISPKSHRSSRPKT